MIGSFHQSHIATLRMTVVLLYDNDNDNIDHDNHIYMEAHEITESFRSDD